MCKAKAKRRTKEKDKAFTELMYKFLYFTNILDKWYCNVILGCVMVVLDSGYFIENSFDSYIIMYFEIVKKGLLFKDTEKDVYRVSKNGVPIRNKLDYTAFGMLAGFAIKEDAEEHLKKIKQFQGFL